MKTLDLFESAEDKNGSVHINMEVLGNRKHVTVNIDYQDINQHSQRFNLNDPRNPDLQQWALHKMSKDNPQLAQQLKDFTTAERAAVKQVEAEVLEMVGAFKALINAMMLEKQHDLVAQWQQIVAQYQDNEEYQAALK